MPPKKIKTIHEGDPRTKKELEDDIEAVLATLEPHYMELFMDVLESEYPSKAKWSYYNKTQLIEIFDLANQASAEQLEDYLAKPLAVEIPEAYDARSIFTKRGYRLENITDLKEFYEMAKILVEKGNEGQPFTDIVVFMRDQENGGRPRVIQISANYLDTFEDFVERLEQILTGNLAGSDRWRGSTLGDWEIDNTRIDLKQVGIFGNGKSEKIIFETSGIEGKELDCVYKCLEKCGVSTKEVGLQHLDKLIEFIEKHQLPIDILLNTFYLNKPLTELLKNDKTKFKTDKTLIILTKLNLEDINPIFAHRVGQTGLGYEREAKHTIILDIENKHYDYLKNNKITLKPNLYIDAKFNTYEKEQNDGKETFKLLLTPKMVESRKITKHKTTDLIYCFFDYETIINETNKIVPYSVSYSFIPYKDLETLKSSDIGKITTRIGFNCNEDFVKDIIKKSPNSKLVFVGFKNSQFDNFILIDYLLENKYLGLEVSDIFYNNNTILNARINKIHSFFDLGNHLMGSLKYNCDSFGLSSEESKLTFNHNEAQRLYDEGKLLEFITDNKDLIDYNERDILATAIITAKYKKTLEELPLIKNEFSELHEIPTIGNLSLRMFKQNALNRHLELPKFTSDLLPFYNKLVKSKVAGRVELFNGVKKVNSHIYSLDVCSLYPYVMSVAPLYYPIGKWDYYTKYNPKTHKEEIGFWVCDIDQTNLKIQDLPLILPYKNKDGNDWECEEAIKQSRILVDTNTIALLEKYGCKVKRFDGWVSNKIKNIDLFGYNLELMKMKNTEDQKKKSKDPTYNSSLRETTKLIMNSGSGKMLEQLHTEITEEVRTALEFLNIKKITEDIETYSVGDRTFCKYELPQEKVLQQVKDLKFTYPIGCFIYSYARGYMYEYSYSKIGKSNLLYTDTDATKITKDVAINWIDWVNKNNVIVPHWEEVEQIDSRYKEHKIYEPSSKVFGSFENELEEIETENPTFYCLQKKVWFYGNEENNKYRFKGISPKNSYILNKEDEIINFTKEKFILTKKPNEIFKWTLENENRLVEKNPINLFNELYENKEVIVLTSSFRKDIRTHSLERVYMVKNCKLNDL